MFGWVYWPNRWAPYNPHLICCLVGCITITSQICSFPNTPGPRILTPFLIFVSFFCPHIFLLLLPPALQIYPHFFCFHNKSSTLFHRRPISVYTGLLLPGDRIMGLDTPSGGNTSHGYYTPHGRKVSSASIFFESLPYKVNPQTGALDFRPKILICGGSSYSREWDYGRFRQIADKCGAVLLCDMAQISGLIAAKRKGC
ncbi:hypothetical protein ES332_A03G143900v1 [Gossypium tomentosum]|uniref:Serine hydroxymethyltransferase-like domain-containing protein n=1 Tax=Gossypium tomentosum TaxID=34277 RepID=A0A5D2RA91_GOSTO|nr:hypothetical protein ES332_A03G143900v1 [Gossypium tomentosum]